MTLYKLTAQFQNLLEMASDPEVDWDIFEDTLEALEGDIEAKADGYAKVIEQLDSEKAAIDYEIKRLTAQKTVRQNSIDRMKAALKTSMEVTGKTKFKTDLFSFGIRKNPASVVITDEEKVSKDFLVPQPPKIDKKAIKEALNDGAEFDWAHLEQGTSLSIK